MSKANEPAYPMCNELGNLYAEGLSKREKLAMEIYAVVISTGGNDDHLGKTAKEKLAELARRSIIAADIFFEQLNK